MPESQHTLINANDFLSLSQLRTSPGKIPKARTMLPESQAITSKTKIPRAPNLPSSGSMVLTDEAKQAEWARILA
jgi:hypothetical protein